MIRRKLIALALCLLTAAALTAHAGLTSDAYFSDTKTGSISGTIGTWARPCTFEVGASTARHWDPEQQSAKLMTIAYLDIDGQMRLDFGDEVPGNRNSSPDVIRIVSHDSVARGVTWLLSGPLGSFIERVEIAGGSQTLEAGSTARVRIQLAIPKNASPGEYIGVLLVMVQGGDELRLPMTVTVRERSKPQADPTSTPDVETTPEPATPAPLPSSTTVVTPSPTPSADAPTTPEPSPVVTPLSTPTATLQTLPTRSAHPSGTGASSA